MATDREGSQNRNSNSSLALVFRISKGFHKRKHHLFILFVCPTSQLEILDYAMRLHRMNNVIFFTGFQKTFT
jgi:hypothetical protein